MESEASDDFRRDEVGGVVVVRMTGPEIPPRAREPLYDLADGLVDAPKPRRVVLDLDGVKSLNSATIGLLVNFQKRVRDAGGALKICGLDPFVQNIFRLTKMDQLFDLHDGRDEAVRSFQGQGRPKPPGGPAPSSWVSRFFGGGDRSGKGG